MPAFDRRIPDFEAANAQVLGISTDTPLERMLRGARYARLADGAEERVTAGELAARLAAGER